MARIPIPQYQQRQRTPLDTPMARAPMVAVEDQTGRALQGTARDIGQVANVAQRVEHEANRAWSSNAASGGQVKWLTRFNELKDSAGPGAPDFTPNLLKEFDDYSSQELQNAPESARPFYREQLTQLRTYLGTHAVGFQADQQRKNTVNNYDEGARADAAAIALDPTLYEARRAARMAVLNTSSLPEEQRREIAVKSESTLAYAAGAAWIDRDPRAALDAFRSTTEGRTPQGFAWVNRLGADNVIRLRNQAQNEVDRIDNKSRINSDRAEVVATRAISEMEAQADSGVPATPEKQLAWASAVAGTAQEGEYRSRLEWQGTVQDVLRRPIPDQLGFIRSERQRLLTQGGDRREAANVDRLEKTVQANVKLLQENPLQWASNRAGIDVPPMDFATLGTPDGAASVGQQLRARADIVAGVQRSQPGEPVQMRPLLANEAQALSSAFAQSSTQDKRKLLGTLYHATGGGDVYRGVMGQLDGVSPFMARMGERAASYEQAQLTNNWFSADVVQSAGDVAAVGMHGDEVLRAGGKDGALKFPVPKDTEFVSAIQSKIGNLYRGAGPGESGAKQFQDDAYAVKAYYVGRAAQSGDLSEGVDSDRLDQAITAVLGNPVDFKGNGTVLAPWGMNAEAFQDRATKAVWQQVTDQGMQDQLGSHMNNTGLIGVGGGAYFVTLAGLPLAGNDGRPVMIRMSPDADAGRDTYGRSLGDLIPRDQKVAR